MEGVVWGREPFSPSLQDGERVCLSEAKNKSLLTYAFFWIIGDRSKEVAEVARWKGAGMAKGRDRGVKPFGHTAIAKFLEARIEEMKGFKTQREIAEEV